MLQQEITTLREDVKFWKDSFETRTKDWANCIDENERLRARIAELETAKLGQKQG